VFCVRTQTVPAVSAVCRTLAELNWQVVVSGTALTLELEARAASAAGKPVNDTSRGQFLTAWSADHARMFLTAFVKENHARAAGGGSAGSAGAGSSLVPVATDAVHAGVDVQDVCADDTGLFPSTLDGVRSEGGGACIGMISSILPLCFTVRLPYVGMPVAAFAWLRFARRSATRFGAVRWYAGEPEVRKCKQGPPCSHPKGRHDWTRRGVSG
jgi:hypothetical protein